MTFEILSNIIRNLISTIQQTAIGTARALKSHIYSVKVKNFPTTQAIKGTVVVSNQKKVEKILKNNNETYKIILNLLKNFKQIKIANFPDPIKPQSYPREIKINNFPKQLPYPKNIRVSNQPTKEIKNVSKYIKAVEKAIKSLKLDPKINVKAPKSEKIVIPAPTVTVTQTKIDYKKLAKLFPVIKEPKEIDYKKLSEAIAKEIAGMVIGVGGGGKRKEGSDDLTRSYNIADKDIDATVNYYGFTGRTGNWYILRENTTTNEYRYIKGSNNYVTNWANRTTLSYDYYHEIF